jgi:transposase
VTVVSDIDKGSLIEVIDSHKSDEIIDVLKQQPQAVRENVKEVSVDMWGGFQKVIKEVFPNALIVIDRFHVMQLVNQSLNRIRLKLELRGLKNRCLLLKNGVDLSREEKLARIVLGKAAKAINNHLQDICNYFISQTTSEVMEGINTKIKLIVRQSYGFRNFEHLREKLLACLF